VIGRHVSPISHCLGDLQQKAHLPVLPQKVRKLESVPSCRRAPPRFALRLPLPADNYRGRTGAQCCAAAANRRYYLSGHGLVGRATMSLPFGTKEDERGGHWEARSVLLGLEQLNDKDPIPRVGWPLALGTHSGPLRARLPDLEGSLEPRQGLRAILSKWVHRCNSVTVPPPRTVHISFSVLSGQAASRGRRGKKAAFWFFICLTACASQLPESIA